MAIESVAISEGSGKNIAVDTIDSKEFQAIKLVLGADGEMDALVDSGQQAMADSVPVVVASDQSAVPVSGPLTDTELRATDLPVTLDGEAVVLGAGSAAIGKLAANSGVDIGDVDVISCALPTGAATEATLSTIDADTSALAACADGAEPQVDVVGALPAGTALIGNVGIDQATANANEVVTKTGSVTAATAANTLVPVTCAIAESGSLSAEIDLGEGRCLCAIDMPADWDAASLTFQASYNSGGTFDNLYDQYGTEKSVTAAADRYIPLDDPAFWLGVRYLKVRSGTAASAVNQTAARTIYLVTKPV